MKRIVDIPDEMYDWFDNGFPSEDDYVKLWETIREGTPLEEEFQKIKNEILKLEDEETDLDDDHEFGMYQGYKCCELLIGKLISELRIEAEMKNKIYLDCEGSNSEHLAILKGEQR